MDANTLALGLNALLSLFIPAITNALKKKFPQVSGIWTVVTTSILGVLLCLGLGTFNLVVYPDQSFWMTVLLGLGVNQTVAQAGWTIYKKIKKIP